MGLHHIQRGTIQKEFKPSLLFLEEHKTQTQLLLVFYYLALCISQGWPLTSFALTPGLSQPPLLLPLPNIYSKPFSTPHPSILFKYPLPTQKPLGEKVPITFCYCFRGMGHLFLCPFSYFWSIATHRSNQ